jgi:hypothetical protein
VTEDGPVLGLSWALRWSLIFVAAQIAGIVTNALLLAVDALGVATRDHVDNSAGNLWRNYVVGQIDSPLLLAVPLVLALVVLWFVGPRLGGVGFRVLSLVVFLWITPCALVFWSGEFSLWTWLVAQLAVAATIRLPRARRRVSVPA